MTIRPRHHAIGVMVLFLAAPVTKSHVTPPRILMTDLEAAQLLLPEARQITAHQMAFTEAQRQAAKAKFAWRPDERTYRYYVGLDEKGRLVGTVVFIGEITVHGLVRSGVALDPEGKIKGATVVAVTDECYVWVKPHIDRNFARDFAGKDGQADFGEVRATAGQGKQSMVRFYGQVLVSLLRRGAIVYEAGKLGGTTS